MSGDSRPAHDSVMIMLEKCRCVSFVVAALCLLLTGIAPAAFAAALDPSFASQVDALKTLGDAQSGELKEIIAAAEKIAAGPILARAYSLEDMKKGVVDGKRYFDTKAKADSIVQRRPKLAETFALATYDVSACRAVLNELPLLAAVYRLNGSPAIRKYLIAQLDEVATWDPFQRPGWTASAMPGEALPVGGDGVWLATGTIIQGLCITLNVLPPDALPAELKAKLDAALQRELKRTATDWKDKRPWFVKQGKANSNQWIVPASGLVIACAYLGPEKFPEEYAIGLNAIRQSMEETGSDGSMSEGFTYGLDWSSTSLLLANRFVRMAGEDPFAKYSFVKKFPLWAALAFQPAESVVNCFDGFGAQRKAGVLSFRRQINRSAAITTDEGLLWLVSHQIGGPSHDFFGLLTVGGSAKAIQPPPTSGLFSRSCLFIWRSSWDQNATGLWLRGGDNADFHDHWDRGHLNLILRGKLVFIEAGTPNYSDPLKKKEYDSLVGHNVLQVGDDILPVKKAAPITVINQSPEGGKISVEAGGTYPDLAGWKREVTWTLDKATIIDTIRAKAQPRPLTLRWHLATAEKAVLSGDGKQITVKIPAGRQEFQPWIGKWEGDSPAPTAPDIFETPAMVLELNSNVPIKVSQVQRIDHTIKFRRMANLHTTIEISPEPIAAEWTLQTAVSLGE